MSRLIMWNLISLDGRFEGPEPWALDFHRHAWSGDLEEFIVEQLQAAAGLLFGRITYEGMAAHWADGHGVVADLMNALPKTVFSHSLAQAGWSYTRLIGGDALDEVRRMKSAGEGNLFVFGSAALSSTLTRAGLFDEYRLGLVPSVLGLGRALFAEDASPMRLRLIEARPFPAGFVLLRYSPADVTAADSRTTIE